MIFRGTMARRGSGEGSVYQRKDGYWVAKVSLGTRDGKRQRKEFYGKTRREAQQKLKAFLQDQQKGLLIINEKLTVEAYLQQWLEQIVKVKNKPRTYDSYRDTVRLYLVPALGQYRLTLLAPAHVQRTLNDLQASGLSARTVAYVRAVLRVALNQALRWGYVVRNAAALAEPPRQEQTQITPLTATQVHQLLAAVHGHRLETLYYVALGLGLRRGELLALRWADVDLAAQRLCITQGKTTSSIRTLPLSPVLVAALERHWERQQTEQAALGAAWNEHGLVFPSEVGTPLIGRNLLRHFKAALKHAELPASTRFHDLRHSCASFLIEQGVHPRVVMEILGHSQIAVTMNTYGHVPSDAQQAALDGLAHLFNSGNEKGG